MTSDAHERACDRTAEAMLTIEKEMGNQVDVVVMVQGDEPMVTPGMISASLEPFSDESVNVVNLMATIHSDREFEDPNEIKVVVDRQGYAIYFSREPIPTRKKDFREVPMLKQICIIPFRRDYLLEFNNTKQTILERIESIDMLRVIESGGRVHMVMTEHPSIGVDTPRDLETVTALMDGELLMREYLS